jgi:hypothetical protein
LKPNLDLKKFNLENYHQYVDDNLHGEVIKKSRRLFPSDLGFDSEEIVKNLGLYLGAELTFYNPGLIASTG